jgi:hypothetical protein
LSASGAVHNEEASAPHLKFKNDVKMPTWICGGAKNVCQNLSGGHRIGRGFGQGMKKHRIA